MKNALLCGGRALGIEDEKLFRVLKTTEENLSAYGLYREGITIVDDVYNSSPDSIAERLRRLDAQWKEASCRIGDVLELGETAEADPSCIGESRR